MTSLLPRLHAGVQSGENGATFSCSLFLRMKDFSGKSDLTENS
jgi:hypothetical protein